MTHGEAEGRDYLPENPDYYDDEDDWRYDDDPNVGGLAFCPKCEGSGQSWDGLCECDECGGEGYIEE